MSRRSSALHRQPKTRLISSHSDSSDIFMASLTRQRLVDSLHEVGLVAFANNQPTDQLRQLYLSYCQARNEGCSSLSHDQIFKLLRAFGSNPGPVMETTRNLYQKRLDSKLSQSGKFIPKSLSLAAGSEPDNRDYGNYSTVNDEIKDEDLIHIEQKATQVGKSLLTQPDMNSPSQISTKVTPLSRSIPVEQSLSPIEPKSGAIKPPSKKDPQTSTPKQDSPSSAAFGLFSSQHPPTKSSPPLQSRALAADFSLSDIPTRAPLTNATHARRSVWASSMSSNQQRIASRLFGNPPTDVKSSKGLSTDVNIVQRPFRDRYFPSGSDNVQQRRIDLADIGTRARQVDDYISDRLTVSTPQNPQIQEDSSGNERWSLRMMLQIITISSIGILIFLAYLFIEENPKKPIA